MRARKSTHAEKNNSDNEVNDQDKSKSKFKPELGPKLAYMSLLALGLSSLSFTWFILLQSQPVFVYLGLTVIHLGLVFSLGKSFLPCHYSVWWHSCVLGIAVSSGN